MTELEAKMKLDDPRLVLGSLARLEHQHLGDRFEVNAFYDTPDRSLTRTDQGLRLRSMTDNASGATTVKLTYKGPQVASVLKQREELELDVHDLATASRLLERLGYRQLLAFEKRRKSFRVGGCLVDFDTLPVLGEFIEIEGPSSESILAVRQGLGLENVALITMPYPAMLDSAIRDGKVRGPYVGF